jgi:DNA-binding transcriptional ArsR family regulator
MDELSGTLKALSDQTRLNIVCLLLTHDFCVGALAKRLDISEAAVSQHLQVLRKAGLVKGEKRGYYVHYWVEREALKTTAEKLLELASRIPQPEGGCRKHMPGEYECCKSKHQNSE